LGTFSVGALPEYIAFDGVNLWVTNHDGNTVTKLRPADGVTLGTFPAGGAPLGVAFDGANIWVANGAGTVSKL
jgi:DNA-binding beta-propeller fold protein YncE